MREDDAKGKWCPFARVIDYSMYEGIPSVTGNRSTMSPPTEALNGAALCIGSQCMAWRCHGGHADAEPSGEFGMMKEPDHD